MTERKTQEIELCLCGGKQEITLIARGIGGAMQFGAIGPVHALDVMAGGHAIGVEIAGGFQQVLELHPFVAADAGHRRGTRKVAFGELVDHRVLEDVFVVQHVMGEAHFLGHPARIMDVTARAAGAFLGQGRPVIVELQGHADHVIALFCKHCGNDRTVHPARHRHDDTGLRGRLGKAERIHGMGVEGHGELRGFRAQYRKKPPILKGPVTAC